MAAQVQHIARKKARQLGYPDEDGPALVQAWEGHSPPSLGPSPPPSLGSSLAPVCAPGAEHTGRWSRLEHDRFVDGLKKWGKEWKRVAGEVGTRTVVQTRTHAQKYFQKLQKHMANGASLEDAVEASKEDSDYEDEGGGSRGEGGGCGPGEQGGGGSGASGGGGRRGGERTIQPDPIFSLPSTPVGGHLPSTFITGGGGGGRGGRYGEGGVEEEEGGGGREAGGAMEAGEARQGSGGGGRGGRGGGRGGRGRRGGGGRLDE
ncbi:SANT/Myb domain protein [Nannochloropsis gaditana]|uniref:SANT/Myb domain protein n=1 Tax=Nannochloropsis gaditana TaxID=72520 RepID=W7TIJ3_9STRA|nr:SANT/Myb domain protein [Nannochloropsis gaditana]